MNTLIVVAHPEPTSFNSRLSQVAHHTLAQSGASVQISDLYATDFHPAEAARHFKVRANAQYFDAQLEQRFSFEHAALPAEVSEEISRIQRADLVLFQFPLWWFGMPAILKGWMDRVLVYGGMYSSSRTHDRGVCRCKKALMCVTTGASERACGPNGKEGDTKLLLWPALYTLRYVGFAVLQPFIIHGVRGGLSGAEAEAAETYLCGVEQRYATFLRNLHDAPAIPFNTDEDFDENDQLKPGAAAYSPFIRQESGA